MLNEVINEMKRMNRGSMEKDTESEEFSSPATGGRKVSFSREISVNQYMGESFSLWKTPVSSPMGKILVLYTFFKKVLEDISSFCGATDTPVLDFW